MIGVCMIPHRNSASLMVPVRVFFSPPNLDLNDSGNLGRWRCFRHGFRIKRQTRSFSSFDMTSCATQNVVHGLIQYSKIGNAQN